MVDTTSSVEDHNASFPEFPGKSWNNARTRQLYEFRDETNVVLDIHVVVSKSFGSKIKNDENHQCCTSMCIRRPVNGKNSPQLL